MSEFLTLAEVRLSTKIRSIAMVAATVYAMQSIGISPVPSANRLLRRYAPRKAAALWKASDKDHLSSMATSAPHLPRDVYFPGYQMNPNNRGPRANLRLHFRTLRHEFFRFRAMTLGCAKIRPRLAAKPGHCSIIPRVNRQICRGQSRRGRLCTSNMRFGRSRVIHCRWIL